VPGGDGDPEDTKHGVRSGEREVSSVVKRDEARIDERSDEVAVTAWGKVEGSQRLKRRRITLDLNGPPLALPGEPVPNSSVPPSPPADVDGSLPRIDAPSAELALPDLERLMLGRPSTLGEPVPPELDDGWGRSREMPPNAPPRPRASTPPPFNVAMAQGVKVPSSGDARRLVAQRRPPGSSVLDLEGEMIDRYALGDFTGALLAAELVLGKQADHFEAKKCAASCRERLCHLHLSRLGGAARVPLVAVDGSEVRWLGLDHRAGFLLSHVDGASTIEELVDLSGMARHEALKILVELMDAGALKIS
jgi:hypothetical protein